MQLLSTLVVALLSCCSHGQTLTTSALQDQIHDLPGLPKQTTPFEFKMFSGYIRVDDGSDDANKREMFYWFTESMQSPLDDPVVLWTNGGPGCSGLSGFLTEQGPYRPTKTADGSVVLKPNRFPWNRIANMIFIEQPAGVGFSTAPSDYDKYGDASSAQDNRRFILGFFERFPHLKRNDFYITSESYGGHYMPTLALEIVKQSGVPNFKGFAVGNPLTYMPYRNYGQFATFYGHQLLPKPLWDQYEKTDCAKDPGSCQVLEGKMMDIVSSHINPYALDFPVCDDKTKRAGRFERYMLMKKINQAQNVKDYLPKELQPCAADYATEYLNIPAVQQAIHAKPGSKWSECSMVVGERFNQDDVNQPMMPIYKELIEKYPGLKILVYSGDDDSVCATLGSQQWIWDMGVSCTKYWEPWVVEDQLGGFLSKFEGFSFLTVHGAGHMVPSTRPFQAFRLLQEFLQGKLTSTAQQARQSNNNNLRGELSVGE